MNEAGSPQRSAWHCAGRDSDSDCKVEAIVLISAATRGGQSQERSSSLKSSADLLRPPELLARAARLSAYDRRLSLAVSGRTNRRIAGGKADRTPYKKVRPAAFLTPPAAKTESEISLAVGPVPVIVASTLRACTGPLAQEIRRIWVLLGCWSALAIFAILAARS
jgi:hypothetical protein